MTEVIVCVLEGGSRSMSLDCFRVGTSADTLFVPVVIRVAGIDAEEGGAGDTGLLRRTDIGVFPFGTGGI